MSRRLAHTETSALILEATLMADVMEAELRIQTARMNCLRRLRAALIAAEARIAELDPDATPCPQWWRA